MINLISVHLEEIKAACRKFNVDKLWLFGSALDESWNPVKSDVDFIAEFGTSDRSLFRQHMGLIGELQDVLGVPVEVVDARSISIPDLRDEIENTRELLFERSHQTISA